MAGKTGKERYAERIAKGLAQGLSKSQARGHPKKGEQTATQRKAEVKNRRERVAQGRTAPKPTRYPTSFHIVGDQKLKGGKVRHRDFFVALSPEQGKEVKRLLDLGKPITAKTYVLAEVYGSNSTERFPGPTAGTPILAGIESYQNGWDYDNNNVFPVRTGYNGNPEFEGIDYHAEDFYPDFIDTEGEGGTDPYIA